MKRVGYMIGLLGILLLGLTGCGSNDIVIGALITTTSVDGSPAEGADLLRGMELAVEEINQKGGINGSRIVIEHTDVHADPETAREAFVEMEKKGDPLVYVSSLSTVSIAAADIAENSRVPLIAAVTSVPGIAEGRSRVFRFWPSVDDQTVPMLRMLNLIKPKEIAIFYPDEEYGRSFYAAYEPSLSAAGVVVAPIIFPPSTTAFGDYVKDLSTYDTVIITGYKAHIVSLVRNIKSAGYDGRIVTTSTASSPDVRSSASMDGVYMLAPALYNTSNITARRFVEDFESYFAAPANHMAGNGYDVVMLIAQLLEDREVSRESLTRQLDKGFVYPGVNGTVNVRPGEHEFGFPYLPARSMSGHLSYL